MKDLKLVYQASTKDLAEDELLKLEDKWGKKYPIVLQSWNNKWENLSVYFKYPKEIRKVIHLIIKKGNACYNFLTLTF